MFLQRRNRILRNNASIRSLVAETVLSPSDFIAPLFIDEGENIAFEIPSMPGYYRRSIDGTIKEVKERGPESCISDINTCSGCGKNGFG